MISDVQKLKNALDAKAFVQSAIEETGLTDFGDQELEGRLERLLDRVAQEAHFKEDGLANFQSTVHRLLINRLRIQEDLKRHPEILEQQIVKPIIILGMPRTGTTKLQRMMSAAPNVQKLSLWRLLNPAPFPNTIPGKTDPRITALTGGEMMLDDSDQAAGLRAAHKMGLTEADEEIVLFDLLFDPSIMGFSPYFPIHFHKEWLPGTEERYEDYLAYDYLRVLLQYLQWQDNSGAPDRPWIMKSPGHSAHLIALYKAFPDATFVQSHRHPCEVVPSVCKFLTSLWELNFDIEKKSIGPRMYDWLRAGMNRFLEARYQLELDDRIIDARYADIRSNIMPIIESIFKHNGRELTDDARRAMLQWEQANEEGKHGRSDYSLAEFNLDESQINAGFAKYIERFSDYF